MRKIIIKVIKQSYYINKFFIESMLLKMDNIKTPSQIWLMMMVPWGIYNVVMVYVTEVEDLDWLAYINVVVISSIQTYAICAFAYYDTYYDESDEKSVTKCPTCASKITVTKCPTCALKGIEQWVLPGKHCPRPGCTEESESSYILLVLHTIQFVVLASIMFYPYFYPYIWW